ncbi:DUF736 family protein [Paracoccus sp. IB05]|uniref:DUF736 family protein n=1 Tax=Paracoccus sp. IB05 TaxID=2779367 RepID=UPI001E29E648|nr:DUF736 family protein [Paracoccus sp. IB05]
MVGRYLHLKLESPSFAHPIYANLFDDKDGEGLSLIWSRYNRRSGSSLPIQGLGRQAWAIGTM